MEFILSPGPIQIDRVPKRGLFNVRSGAGQKQFNF